MTGGSAGSASADPKAAAAVPVKRRPALKVTPPSRLKAVLKSAPSNGDKRFHLLWKGMLFQKDQLWCLLSAWPTFPWPTFPWVCRHELPRRQLLPWHLRLRPQRPHLDSCLLQLHLRSQWVRHRFRVQLRSQRLRPRSRCRLSEVDTIMREAEEKRTKRTSDEQQLHDAMLAAIFKSAFEDTVPENVVGIYSSGTLQAVMPSSQEHTSLSSSLQWPLKMLRPKAEANEQSLHEFLENRTIADLVEQFTTDENYSWLRSHGFFMGNNGNFAVVREVSETSCT